MHTLSCRLPRSPGLWIVLMVLLGALAPAAVAQSPEPRFGAGILLSDARIEMLRERVAQRREPTFTAWQRLLEQAEGELDRQPHAPEEWFVPFFYEDRRGHSQAKAGLSGDANGAYRMALAYRITGEERFAVAAVRLIDGWSGLEKLRTDEDSGLSFSYHFPAMIFAADLLRDYPGWPEERQAAFKAFVRERAVPMNTMDRANNWGNWGLVLALGGAAYLHDEALFHRGIERWKEFIATQIAEDGHLHHEVGRNDGKGDRGLWYSHFSLLPQTVAAEIAAVNGVDLYDYESPDGRSLRLAFHRVAPWSRDPSTFPYFKPEGEDDRQGRTNAVSFFELLHPRWPHEDAAAMLAELRPLSAGHAAPHLTFTHGEPLEGE